MASRARNFTVADARQKIVVKLRKAGSKGSATLFTSSTSGDKRGLYEQALREMTSSGVVVATPTRTKPKYFLREFAPSAELAAAKIERYAAAQHPIVLAQPGLAKALVAVEKPFLAEAIQLLEAGARLVKLVHGKAFVFAHAESLRKMIGRPSPSEVSAGHTSLTPHVENGFHVRSTARSRCVSRALHSHWIPRHRDRGIAARIGSRHARFEKLVACGTPGRADKFFPLGDWSLADDRSRAGAVELRGGRYLLVRLED